VAISFSAHADDLKSRKAQGSQTTVQQSLIDVDVVEQQLPKDASKIGQIAPQVKGFKQADASQNIETFCQLARPVIVEQHRIRTQLFRQEEIALISPGPDPYFRCAEGRPAGF
jgi:hypothetical protein